MPVTLMHVKRVQAMHDAGDHNRCDVRQCPQAHDEHSELMAATAAEEAPDFVDELQAKVLRKLSLAL